MQWPKYDELDSFYGNPRHPMDPTRPSPQWELESLTQVRPPFQMTYAGRPIRSIRIHRACAMALQEALDNLWKAAKQNQEIIALWGVDRFGGSYNFRLMRQSSKLSVHSWGAAIDLDPARNGFGNRRPRFSQFPDVVNAFTATGAVWGGHWMGSRCDGMHFQWCR